MASPRLLAWLLLVLAVLPAPCRSVSFSERSASPDRSGLQRLYWDLVESSSATSNVLPFAETAGAPVEVSVDLALNYVTVVSDDIVDLDCWLSLTWNDSRLRWNPRDNNITDIRLPQDAIWTPDITLFNNIDIRQRTTEKFLAIVRHGGEVMVFNKMTIRLPCADDGSGQRSCRARFGSWTYHGFLLDLKTSTSENLLAEYRPSKNYQVTNAGLTRNVLHYTCCPEPFPDVTLTFDLERKSKGWLF